MEYPFYPHTAKRFLVALCCVLLAGNSFTETFRFQFKEGDAYRINSTIAEDVFFNTVFSHQAHITNRVTVNVSDVRSEEGQRPASALHTCTFMTSEKNSKNTFTWGREYPSVFRRDALGVYSIDAQYFMPVVRNVPVFPVHEIQQGEKWQSQGIEAHDLRDTFGIQEPFTVPFTVNYTYQGTTEKNEKTYHVIDADYDLFYEVPASIQAALQKKSRTQQQRNKNTRRLEKPVIYPVKTVGYSKQKLYWDNEAGILPLYTEVFHIKMELNTGDTIEYRGTAQAAITDLVRMDKEKIKENLDKTIQDMGLQNTTVRQTGEGITISIENIQFAADSAQLLPEEKKKLEHIGTVLSQYPQYELLISGHTARAGTLESQQQLSEERASAVAGYLIELGIREPHHIFTQGFGGQNPIAPNTTEENKARNRRVEITILEK
ncbi:MAG: OmpA family protein [Treponema sp.]